MRFLFSHVSVSCRQCNHSRDLIMILGMWLSGPQKMQYQISKILLSEILCLTSWPLTRRPKFGPTCFPGLLSTFSPSRSLRTLQKILQNFVSASCVSSWEKLTMNYKQDDLFEWPFPSSVPKRKSTCGQQKNVQTMFTYKFLQKWWSLNIYL